MLTLPESIRRATSSCMVDVLAPDRGVEAVLGVVGECDALVLGRVAVETDDRTERLGRPGEHVLGDTLEDRRLEERRAEVGAGVAAGEHRGALGLGVLDVRGDAVLLVDRHERAHVGQEVVRSADVHGLGRSDELVRNSS